MTLLTDFTAKLSETIKKDDLSHIKNRQNKNNDISEKMAAFVKDGFEFFQTYAPKHKKNTHKLQIRIHRDKRQKIQEQKIAIIEAVNDDKPFLLDSILAYLNENAIKIHLVLHPIIIIKTDNNKKLTHIYRKQTHHNHSQNSKRKSFIHIHIEPPDTDPKCVTLKKELDSILNNVHRVVADWMSMRKKMQHLINAFKNATTNTQNQNTQNGERAESSDFLDWLLNDHFTFMGMKDYAFVGDEKKGKITPIHNTGLGLMKDEAFQILRKGKKMVSDTPEIRRFLAKKTPYLIVAKANIKAKVHRRTYMDYIGIKRLSDTGQVIGECRLIGLFTSAAYVRSPRAIPLLRRKVNKVLAASPFKEQGHSSKALLNVLETYPRDELFQTDNHTLGNFAHQILRLDEHPKTHLLVRNDPFDRFVSIILYMPKERYNTDIQNRIGKRLAHIYDGRFSASYPDFPEGILARVHYIIGRYGGTTPKPDIETVEEKIIAMMRKWEDHFRDEIRQTIHTADHRAHIITQYAHAFSPAYQDRFSAKEALNDIKHMEQALKDDTIRVKLYRHKQDLTHHCRLKIYHAGDPISLSGFLPILENMGLCAIEENTYRVARGKINENDDTHQNNPVSNIFIHDVFLITAENKPLDIDMRKSDIEDAYYAIWKAYTDNDAYNALIINAALSWRHAMILRAIGAYLRQIGSQFSFSYMAQTLNRYPHIAHALVQLFITRFDPKKKEVKKRHQTYRKIQSEIRNALDAVPNLNEDRIIRRFENIITAMMRTNFFCQNIHPLNKEIIAFKLSGAHIEALPKPKPFAEIYVYAHDVEAVHLRGGEIARGGLRWSDREQDFRTEVLGLAKAQKVKNALIIPVGAKGGFVARHLPKNRQDARAESQRCYKLFINALIQITDNIIKGKIIHPANVVRYDHDDPYLVVAADKGTATFSDIANEISENNQFWLNDAFASGGSAGYDHKKMGITARGAWESVKRHFDQIGHNTQTTPFSVIGVGDMSGDVFGNGMLLSPHIKLIAAFDHRDIFIDPNPECEKSMKERRRLFENPTLSWQDYNKKHISKGGGVFSRQLKNIPLTDEIRTLTGMKAAAATPNELIRAILHTKADMLWFGGIGTYVRHSQETDEDADDRVNDPVRVEAKNLRVRVIGEGANLACTQKARIEFAQNGGRINTDAVDNSAGVNSSDMEVNIKIALAHAEEKKKITRKQRNRILETMTDEVASLVLHNNIHQNLCITMALLNGDFKNHIAMMRELENNGALDRNLEDLPNDEDIIKRQEKAAALTRPEIAVLMAYAKITLFESLKQSDILKLPELEKDLIAYFPKPMRKKYRREILNHTLRPQIIATHLVNSMINRGGPDFIYRLQTQTQADMTTLARAFIITRAVFQIRKWADLIEDAAADTSWENRAALHTMLSAFLYNQTLWFIYNNDVHDPEAVITIYQKAVNALLPALPHIITDPMRRDYEKRKHALSHNFPEHTAHIFAAMPWIGDLCDIICLAQTIKAPLNTAAKLFFTLSQNLHITQLVTQGETIAITQTYEQNARNTLIHEIRQSRNRLTADILKKATHKTSRAGDAEKLYQNWCKNDPNHEKQAKNRLRDILKEDTFSISHLYVGAQILDRLADHHGV